MREHSAYTDAIASLYRDGLTGQAIADQLGVSRQAVFKHIKRAGLTRKDGGACKRARDRTAGLCAEGEAVALRHGMTRSQWCRLVEGGLTKAFEEQRWAWQSKGNDFQLTFGQWLQIWIDSGKLHMRGTYSGACGMTRKDKSRPLTVKNAVVVEFGKFKQPAP